MPWNLQIGESRGEITDERFTSGGVEAEYVIDFCGVGY
jgi:hypothetical protein